jgi:hypothetical protein
MSSSGFSSGRQTATFDISFYGEMVTDGAIVELGMKWVTDASLGQLEDSSLTFVKFGHVSYDQPSHVMWRITATADVDNRTVHLIEGDRPMATDEGVETDDLIPHILGRTMIDIPPHPTGGPGLELRWAVYMEGRARVNVIRYSTTGIGQTDESAQAYAAATRTAAATDAHVHVHDLTGDGDGGGGSGSGSGGAGAKRKRSE